MEYDMTVLENITNVHGNIYAISETKQFVKLQMKKLCDHPFWRPFLEKYVEFNNCYILKGKYHTVINAQDLARKYYSGSFIYGQWIFKSTLYSNDCNFNCVRVEMALTPKQKKS